MIVRRVGDGELFCVTQTDHAALAAEILALWRTDGLPEHRWRRELLFAVREHDNGWREADSAPRRGPGGGPCDFRETPDAQRQEIWSRGVERWVDDEPLATRWILRHARALHRDREDSDWAALYERWSEIDVELGERTDAADDDVDAEYGWLSLADEISLSLAMGRCAEVERDGRRLCFVPGPFGDPTPDRITIHPFPLAGTTSFDLRGRRIPDRAWHDDTSLAVALATARWETRRIRVERELGPPESPSSR